jgi:hypothetical protein
MTVQNFVTLCTYRQFKITFGSIAKTYSHAATGPLLLSSYVELNLKEQIQANMNAYQLIKGFVLFVMTR